MAHDDTQLAVAFRDSEYTWSWRSFIQIPTHDRAVIALAELRQDETQGWLKPLSLADGKSIESLGSNKIHIGPREGMSAKWQASVEITDDLMATPHGFSVRIEDLQFERKAPSAAYHRIVYRGLRIPGYTNSLWLTNTEGAKRHGYTPLRLFNRDVILSEIWSGDDLDECYVGVTIAGDWFSQVELDAFELMLYLLAGIGGIRQCVESFDEDGRWQGRSFHRFGHATNVDSSIVFPPENYTDESFYLQFTNMVDRAKVLVEKAFPLRAILYHVFSSQQFVPEIAITHLAIALDGAKTAVVEKVKGEGKLMAQEVFEKRISVVVEAAQREFSGPEDAASLELIQRSIEDANDWSERERWKRFWRDYINYELTEAERSVLDHRGPAIHDAYILLTEYDLILSQRENVDRRPYEERLRDLVTDAKIFRNIVNRVILMLLGYTGEFMDFAGTHQRLRVEPAS